MQRESLPVPATETHAAGEQVTFTEPSLTATSWLSGAWLE